MAGWVFQAVPKKYDLIAALRERSTDLWTVSTRQWRLMGPGQTVYFWLGAPVGGVVAVGAISGHPEEEPPSPEQTRQWREDAGARAALPMRRVPVQYLKSFPTNPLRRQELKLWPELAQQPPVAGFLAATNFLLSPEAAARLETLAGGR